MGRVVEIADATTDLPRLQGPNTCEFHPVRPLRRTTTGLHFVPGHRHLLEVLLQHDCIFRRLTGGHDGLRTVQRQ
jgi:hypothetical protein